MKDVVATQVQQEGSHYCYAEARGCVEEESDWLGGIHAAVGIVVDGIVVLVDHPRRGEGDRRGDLESQVDHCALAVEGSLDLGSVANMAEVDSGLGKAGFVEDDMEAERCRVVVADKVDSGREAVKRLAEGKVEAAVDMVGQAADDVELRAVVDYIHSKAGVEREKHFAGDMTVPGLAVGDREWADQRRHRTAVEVRCMVAERDNSPNRLADWN